MGDFGLRRDLLHGSELSITIFRMLLSISLVLGVLVFIGALDDRFDISVKIRATIQAAVGIVMMVFGKLYLSSLGYIFGSGRWCSDRLVTS